MRISLSPFGAISRQVRSRFHESNITKHLRSITIMLLLIAIPTATGFLSANIHDPTLLPTVIIMTLTAVITSTLTSKVKQTAAQAQEKESESNILYQMTNHQIFYSTSKTGGLYALKRDKSKKMAAVMPLPFFKYLVTIG